jgi:pimeloyl-ACP methyl ester carboxylesterase
MSPGIARALARAAAASLVVCLTAAAALAQQDGPSYAGAGVSIAFQGSSTPIVSTGQGASIAFQNGSTAIASTGQGVSIAFQTSSPALGSTGQGVSIAFQTAAPTISQVAQAGVSIGFQNASALPILSAGQGVSIAFQHAGDFSAGSGVTIGFGVIDTTPPETTIVAGPAEGTSIFTRNVTISWSGSDDHPGTLTFSQRIDGGPFSAFDASTSRTFSNLGFGPHTFEVRARDASGNIDPSPAVRHFQIVEPSFVFSVSSGGTTFSQGAAVPLGAFVFEHGNLDQPLDSTVVNVRVTVTDAGAAVVSGPAALTFNPGTGQFAGSLSTSALALGSYQATFAFFATDGTPIGSQSVSFAVIAGFSLTLGTDQPAYGRGQAVDITGQVQDQNGAPVGGIAIALSIGARGVTRQFNVFSSAQGRYEFSFTPPSTETGNYSVTASVLSGGATRQATATFVVYGLMTEPAVTSATMSMNSTLAIPLDIRNIGETALTGIALTVQDLNTGDGVTGTLDVSNVPALAPGASRNFQLTIAAPSGAAPSTPVVFKVVARATQGVTDIASASVTLQNATGAPAVEPSSAAVGMTPGSSRLVPFTLRNQGFAPIVSAQATVENPVIFDWVSLQSGAIGDVAPGGSKPFGVSLQPPSALPLGLYTIRVDVTTGSGTIVVPITVDITSAQARDVAAQISDDAGTDVAGANVSLVSTTLFTRVTGSGAEQFNQIYQGTSDSAGRLELPGVAPGKYTLRVQAAKHADYIADVVIDPGTSAQAVEAILTTKVVDFSFKVNRTSITDQYDVSLVVTYSTDLVKPALIASPARLDLPFFPGTTFGGDITITNSHTQAAVTNIIVDASGLDAAARQLALTFSDTGTTIVPIASLGPRETKTLHFTATLLPGAAPPSHDAGSISISGQYVYSLRGEARQGTTDSQIFVSYIRPQGLRMFPAVSFLDDETGAAPVPLQYQGTTSRIVVEDERDAAIDLLTFDAQATAAPPVNAIQLALPANVPPDQVPLALMTAPALWSGSLDNNRLTGRGSQAAFDVTALIAAVNANRDSVLANPPYLGLVGRWDDGTSAQGFVFPISITTIRPNAVQVVQAGGGTSCSVCGSGGGAIPQSFNNHGIVKVELDQAVSLEREAFNASLDITPAVASLDSFSAALAILDASGHDAGDLFVVTSTDVPSSPITGPSHAGWLIIPKVAAGGTSAAGLNYTVAAHIAYAAGGIAATFDTAPEAFTVTPLPRLTLDYTIPYVVMGDVPFKIRVDVTNAGGTANNVTIASAQPKIIDNSSNLPIGFGLDGSSSTGQDAGFQSGNTTVQLATLGSGETKSAYWQMRASRRGFIIDFSSTITQKTVNGKSLDSLIDAIHLHFQPALGGFAGVAGCNLGPIALTLAGASGSPLAPVLGPAGAYYFAGISPASYQLVLSQGGQILVTRQVDMLAGQPTDFVDLLGDNSRIDSDHDGLPDCWELANGLNPSNPADASADADSDGLTNLQEYLLGTNPRNADSDGDGISDGDEVGQGSDPRNPSDLPYSGPPSQPTNVSAKWAVKVRASLNLVDMNVLVDWTHSAPAKQHVSEYRVYLQEFDFDPAIHCNGIPLFTCLPSVTLGEDRWQQIAVVEGTRTSLVITDVSGLFGLAKKLGLAFAVSAVNASGESAKSEPFKLRPFDGAEATLDQPSAPIVFIHGWHGSGDTWLDTTDTLQKLFGWQGSCEVPLDSTSLPSECNTGIYRLAFGDHALDGVPELAERLDHFLSLLPSPAILIGHSAGGIVARACVQTFPSSCGSHVSRLITYGSPHQGTPFGDAGAFARKLDQVIDSVSNLLASNESFQKAIRSHFHTADHEITIGLLKAIRWSIDQLAQNLVGQLGADLAVTSPVLSNLNADALHKLPPAINYVWIVGSLSSVFDELSKAMNSAGINDSFSQSLLSDLTLLIDSDGFVPAQNQVLAGSANATNIKTFTNVPRFHALPPLTVASLLNGWAESQDYLAVLKALDMPVLEIVQGSPVTITVVDPEGLIASQAFVSIPGAEFGPLGNLTIPFPKPGRYSLLVSPQPDARPADTYTLTVRLNGVDQVVVGNQTIASIPESGFAFDVDGRLFNQPPQIQPQMDRVIEATSSSGANVTLDARESRDPEGHSITIQWSGPFGTTTGALASVDVPLGDHRIAVVVRDEQQRVTSTFVVSVRDSTPPTVHTPSALTIAATVQDGTTALASPALAVFLRSATAVDSVDAAPVALSSQVSGLDVTDNTIFYVGTTTVTFRFLDASGNLGTATSTVTVLPPQHRLSGSGYTNPETPAYRATLSIDAVGPGSPTGSLQYFYSRTRMNFVSTSVTSMSVSGNSVVLAGTGTVNSAGGYTFTATSVLGNPDQFGITIRKSDGSVFYSTAVLNLAGGDLVLQ